MKARSTLLVALAAMVTLASVAAAGPSAAKQRVAITMKVLPRSTFVLTPLQPGAVKGDSGTIDGDWRSAKCHDVIRDGQNVGVCKPTTWTLTGKRGSLTISERNEWVASGNESGCGVAFGTWKVVRGTGDYAGIAGGGRSAHEAHCEVWYARQEGFVRLP